MMTEKTMLDDEMDQRREIDHVCRLRPGEIKSWNHEHWDALDNATAEYLAKVKEITGCTPLVLLCGSELPDLSGPYHLSVNSADEGFLMTKEFLLLKAVIQLCDGPDETTIANYRAYVDGMLECMGDIHTSLKEAYWQMDGEMLDKALADTTGRKVAENADSESA